MQLKPLLDALGRPAAVAAALGINKKAVYGWRERGTVPYRWRPALVALCEAKGVPVPPDLAESVRPSLATPDVLGSRPG